MQGSRTKLIKMEQSDLSGKQQIAPNRVKIKTFVVFILISFLLPFRKQKIQGKEYKSLYS